MTAHGDKDTSLPCHCCHRSCERKTQQSFGKPLAVGWFTVQAFQSCKSVSHLQIIIHTLCQDTHTQTTVLRISTQMRSVNSLLSLLNLPSKDDLAWWLEMRWDGQSHQQNSSLNEQQLFIVWTLLLDVTEESQVTACHHIPAILVSKHVVLSGRSKL